MTDHYREAENLLDLARAHTDTGDERGQRIAETFTARAQVHALLALVTRPSDPWAPGQDVTDRLKAGETAPAGTLLADRDGYIYRVEEDGNGTIWLKWSRRWYSAYKGAWSWRGTDAQHSWKNVKPLQVATPEQIRAAGVEEVS